MTGIFDYKGYKLVVSPVNHMVAVFKSKKEPSLAMFTSLDLAMKFIDDLEKSNG